MVMEDNTARWEFFGSGLAREANKATQSVVKVYEQPETNANFAWLSNKPKMKSLSIHKIQQKCYKLHLHLLQQQNLTNVCVCVYVCVRDSCSRSLRFPLCFICSDAA